MGRTFQSGIISRLVVGGGTYAVLHNETQIDVDNSNGLPTIIKLQPIDPSLGQCTVYINDYGNNSSVGNITVVASAGNLINGQPTLVLDTDGIGAEISVSDQRNFIASLNNDSQSTGGLITADNGLTVFGTNVQLGGSLVLPTTIDALGSNTFSINDQAGLMFQTRDALGNFFFNNIGGTGTLVGSSQYIFSYLGDGGNVFTDSLIVINFGGANNFNQAVDFWNFGDYTQANLSSSIFNIGRFNHFDNVSSTTVMGYSNDLNAVYSSTILGSGNTYSGLNQKFILGNNNNNLIIDGVTGILNSNATYNNTSFAPLNNIVGIDMNGDFYNTGLNASAVLTGAGLPNYISKWTSGSGLTISQLFDNGINVGINTISPTAKLHIKGIDATTSNYALKVDNSSSSPLLYVRNDGVVSINSNQTVNNSQLVINSSNVEGISFLNYSIGNQQIYFDAVFKGGNIIANNTTALGINNFNGQLRFNGATGLTVGNSFSYSTLMLLDSLSGNLSLGLGASVGLARFHLSGVDSTSSNYALKVDNLGLSPLLYVRNDSFTSLGTSTEVIGTSGHKLEAVGTSAIGLGLGAYFSVAFSTSESYAKDMGAGIALGGKYDASGNVNPFAGIGGVKQNATNGDFTGRLNLWVRNGSTIASSFTSVPYGSKVRNGMGIKNPTALLHLDGDNADVFISESKCINIDGYAGKFYSNTINTQNNIGIYSEVSNGLNNYAAILMGYVGVFTQNPTAMLHVKGIDSTSSNYALKIDNSASMPLLYARNDGQIEMNGFTIRQLSSYTIFKTSGTNGYLFNNASDSTNLARLTNTGVLIVNSIATLNSNVGLSIKAQGTSDITKEFIAELYKGSTNNTGISIASKEGVSYIQGTTTANSQTVNLILGGYDGAGNQLENIILKYTGGINTALLPISNVGLVTGDLYVDTAANILANGDKVVGWKV